MSKFKQMPILYPVVVMFAICLVITAALAGTNAVTKEKIEKINKENENAAMARLMKAEDYKECEAEYEDEEVTYYKAVNDGKTDGYIVTVKEKGYGGTVSVMVAVTKEYEVKGVEVLDVTSETPGLGQNTANEAFTKQFAGMKEEKKAVKYGTAEKDNEIDAVASATISSRAITKAVNKAFNIAKYVDTLPDEDADATTQATTMTGGYGE